MEKLAELVHDQLSNPNYNQTPKFSNPQEFVQNNVNHTAAPVLVGTATLELAPSSLHEQIQHFANVAVGAGCQQVQLLPLFLLPGVHVMEDIPAEVALAQANLGNSIVLSLQPHLGANPGLGKILAKQLSAVETDAKILEASQSRTDNRSGSILLPGITQSEQDICATRTLHAHTTNLQQWNAPKILLAHGSRRSGGNEPVKVVADQLGAVVAYWSMQPTLEEQVTTLADAGYQQLTIIPYFLFSGGITDAIAQMVVSSAQQFPQLQLRLGEPIGVSVELAKLIVDLTGK